MRWTILGTFLLLSSTACITNSAPLNGHFKLQHIVNTTSDESIKAALLDYQTTQLSTFDFRTNYQHHQGNIGVAADYELSGRQGSAVELSNILAGSIASQEKTQWIDLDHTLSTSNDRIVSHRLDRFNVSYSDNRIVIKLGRQALTWGNGIVFRPMDLFNPFSPDAVDTSYKPGSDMLYGQWLLDDGSDLSSLIVPRRSPLNNEIEHEQSSAALKWHYFGENIQGDLMLAADYDDTVLAIGLNGSLAEAVWRFEIVPVFLESGGSRTSMIANLDYAWQWRGRNYSGYVEYFRNGFGTTSDNYTLADIPPETIQRINRGQLFNTGRDYLAAGVRVEITALLQISPLLIYNLNDDSALLIIHGNYSIGQDMTLDFGIGISMGSSGTEFGGIENSPGSGVYIEPGDQVYLRLSYYY